MSSNNPELRLILFAFKKGTETRIRRLLMSFIIHPALLHSEGLGRIRRDTPRFSVRLNWTGRVLESSLSGLG